MLSVLAAAVVIAQPETRNVAYVARVYSTNESIRTAYAVFLNDVSGRRPRRITEAADGYDSVVWVGKDRLVWRKWADDNQSVELWTAAQPYVKAKKIATANDIRFVTPEHFTPNSGRPLFLVGAETKPKSVDPVTGDLVEAFVNKPKWRDIVAEGFTKPIMFESPSGKDFNLTMRPNEENFDSNWTGSATKGKVTKKLVAEDHLSRLLYDEEEGDVFVIGWTRDSTIGDSYSLRTFDFAKGSFRVLTKACAEFDFWPARSAYAYVTPKALAPIGESGKQVWVNQLWIGDWKKGVSRKVLGGLAHYVSVAVKN